MVYGPSPKTLVSLFQQCAMLLRSLPSIELSRTSLDVGGKRKIDERTLRRCEWWKKTPRLTSKDLKANLEQSGVMVSTSTIHRTLNQAGLHGRRPRKTPLLKKRHKKERLIFAKEYLGKLQSYWENVLWTDGTKIELFGNAHQHFVYRWCNEAWWRIYNAVGLLCCVWYCRP